MSELGETIRHEHLVDERLTPDDQIGVNPLYTAIRNRFEAVLGDIPVPERPAMLIGLQTVLSNPGGDKKWRMARRQALAGLTTSGVPKKDAKRLLSRIKPHWWMNGFSLAVALDDRMLGLMDESADPVSGGERLLEAARQGGKETEFRDGLKRASFDTLRLKGMDEPVPVIQSSAVNPWFFSEATSAVRHCLQSRMDWNIPDEKFVTLALKLKLFGFLQEESPFSPLMTVEIGRRVKPHHPEFLQRLKEVAAKRPGIDSQRLTQLKGLYEQYFPVWYMQGALENSGSARPLTHEEIRQAVVASGGFRPELSRTSPGADSHPQQAREMAQRLELGDRSTRVAWAQLSRSLHVFRRNLGETTRQYQQPDGLNKDSALLVIRTVIGLYHQNTALSGPELAQELVGAMREKGVIQAADGASDTELALLTCFQALRHAHPGDRDSIAFIQILRDKLAPALDSIHDLPALDREAALMDLERLTYRGAEVGAAMTLQGLSADRDALAWGDGAEIEHLRQELNRNLSDLLDRRFKTFSMRTKAGWLAVKEKRRLVFSPTLLQIMSVLTLAGGAYFFNRDTLYRQNIIQLFAEGFRHEPNNMMDESYTVVIVGIMILAGLMAGGRGGLGFVTGFINRLAGSISALSQKEIQGLTGKKSAVDRAAWVSLLISLVWAFAGLEGGLTISRNQDAIINFAHQTWTWAESLAESGRSARPIDKNFAVANFPERPPLGDPTFYTFGSSRYPGIFWVGKACDLVEGSDGHRIACTDSLQEAEDPSYPGIDAQIKTLDSSVSYASPGEEQALIDREVERGRIVRVNIDGKDFFEIPTGFYPAGLLVPQGRAGERIQARWAFGRGLVIQSGNSRPVRGEGIGVIYERFASPDASGTHYLDAAPNIEFIPNVGETDPTDAAYTVGTSTYLWRYGFVGIPPGDDSGSGQEAGFLFNTVSGQRFNPYDPSVKGRIDPNSLVIWYGDADASRVHPLDLTQQMTITLSSRGKIGLRDKEVGLLVSLAEKWTVVVVKNSKTRDSVFLLAPPEQQADLEPVLERLAELSDAGTPHQLGIRMPLDINSWSADVSDALPLSVVDPQRQPESFSPQSPVVPYEEDVDTMWKSGPVAEALSAAAQTSDPQRQLRIIYQGLLGAGIEYGFESFSTASDQSPEDVLVELMKRGPDGKPIHPELICNQTSYLLFMLMKQFNPNIAIIGGYQQQYDTQYGGNPAAAHQIVAFYNPETGTIESFDSTLPDLNGDASSYPRLSAEKPGVGQGQSILSVEESEGIPSGILAEAATGLILAILYAIKKKNTMSADKASATEDPALERIYARVEGIVDGLSPRQRLGFTYALASSCGMGDVPPPQVNFSKDPASPGHGYEILSGTPLPGDRNLRAHELEASITASYLADLMEKGPGLESPEQLPTRLVRLIELMTSQRFRRRSRNPRIRLFFSRYFSRKVPQEAWESALFNMGTLAYQLKALSRKTSQKPPSPDLAGVADAINQFYHLAVTKS